MPSAPPLLKYIFRPVAEDVVHEEGDERTDRGESRHAERRAVSLEACRSLLIALGAVARGARLHCCFRRTIAACLRWSPSGSFCSFCSCLRRIALCCPRIPCRLRILLSLRPRRSLREVAVHGGAADSSGAAALVSIAVRLGRGSWNFCKFRKPFCSRRFFRRRPILWTMQTSQLQASLIP